MRQPNKNTKPGTKLICVDPGVRLVKDNIYTFKCFVKAGNKYLVNVEESIGGYWASRFIIYNQSLQEIIDSI